MQNYCETNFLQPTGFKVIVSKESLPYLSFMSQSLIHPSMEIEAVEIARPRITGVPFIGDQVNFGSVTMEVLLDEGMNVYGEIYSWMERMLETKHKLNRGVLYNAQSSDLASYADIRIEILTSSNNKNREFQYVNAFPVSLGDVQFNSTTDETFITCPITFRFDYFEFI